VFGTYLMDVIVVVHTERAEVTVRGVRNVLVSPEAVELRGRGPVGVNLAGWERFSTWGWDDREGELFAQLYRNTDDPRDQPAVWISAAAGWPSSTAAPEILAGWIAAATGVDRRAVLLALADSVPHGERLRALAAA
jgi:hypothetical protein